ncbi:MAG: radical SAM family heme chaperone HemW [Acidimicrobiia bacterium]|nr:radical SAM family heme chaperone HemW [Acidimicrobiia bacterium]
MAASPPRTAPPDHAVWAERAAGGLGVYVHVPFCTHRCGYCDFAAFAGLEDLVADYVDALVAEIGGRVDTPADTVFVGGGTPSVLSASELGRLIDAIPRRPDAEVTVEMNPESASGAVLDAARRAGANRVSFGMQSVRPHVLEVLERRHRHGAVETAVAAARVAGFDEVNVDLIYGTPGESEADWAASLEAALALEPDHVSAYALGVEVNTPLGQAVQRGLAHGPEDDVLAARLDTAVHVLRDAGLVRYEISNWTRRRPCLHNLRYWSGGRYVGVGSGAHSFEPSRGLRTWNVRHPRTYIAHMRERGDARQGSEHVTGDAAALERLALGTRRACGMTITPQEAARVPPELVAWGFVDVRHENGVPRLKLTDGGMAVANGIVVELSLALGEC